MALPANQLAGRIPDSYINMWAASLLRGQWNNQVDNIRKKTMHICLAEQHE